MTATPPPAAQPETAAAPAQNAISGARDLADPERIQALVETALPFAIDFGLKVLGAIVVLLIGLRIAGWLSNLVRKRAQASDKIDDTLGSFFASIVKYIALTIVFITVLQVFGVQATSLVAVLGAATLAIGLALQGTLGNVAAGVMVIMFRPYKLGDFVDVAGASGTVTDVNLFTTVLNKVDGVHVIIPNGGAWGGTIVNYSLNPKRRVDLTFGIGYDDDIEKATQVILDVVQKDGRFISDPAEPWVRVVELNESSVDLQLRAWTMASDFWDARFATLKNVKVAFDQNGIEIPYPHAVEIEKPLNPPKAA